jgi:hypothetical protein
MPSGSAILPNGGFLSSGLGDGVFHNANREIGVPGGMVRVGH